MGKFSVKYSSFFIFHLLFFIFPRDFQDILLPALDTTVNDFIEMEKQRGS